MVGYQPVGSPQDAPLLPFIRMDQELGWSLAPSEASDITIEQDGGRRTSDKVLKGPFSKKVVFLGCSFTMGIGIRDSETLAWQMQERIPEWQMKNFGVMGYSALQTYMKMRDVLENEEGADLPTTLVYGFIPEHVSRNVADPFLTWKLASQSTRRSIFMPYSRLKEGKMVVFPPRTFSSTFPFLAENTALFTLFNDLYYFIEGRSAREQGEEIQKRLMLEMQKLSQSEGAELLVLLMRHGEEARKQYGEFFDKHEINYVDGYHPKEAGPSMLVPNDGHPNGAMNTYWADLLEEYFQSEMS